MRLALLFSLTFLFATNNAHAQWQPIESPSGVDLRELVPSDTRVFASTFAGLYYTDDGGNQWTNAFSGVFERGFVSKLQAAGSVVICRIRSIETDEYRVFISENNGDDWQNFPVPPAAGTGFSNVVFNGQTVIYQVFNELYVSTDLGENWTVQNQGNLPFSPNQLSVSNGFFFLSDNDFNLWRSDSLAQNWTSVPLSLGPWELPTMYVDGDFMLAGILDGTIRYSYDGGASWNSSSSILNWDPSNEGFWADEERLYTIHQGGIFTSEDQGVSWTRISPLNSRFTDMVLFDDYTLLGSMHMTYQSPDFSATVIPKVEGLQGISIGDFKLMDGEMLYTSNGSLDLATIGTNQITSSANVFSGLSFDEMVTGGGYYFVNEFTSFGAPYKHEIFRVAPDGSATSIRTSNNGIWLTSDHLKYTDDKLVYFDGTGPYFSTDYGDTWQFLNTITYDGAFIYSYDFERHEDALFDISSEGVRRLRDGEEVWELVNNGLDLESFPLGLGVFDVRLKSTPGALFLLLARGDAEFYEFFVSHDGGDSWQATATDLPGVIIPYLSSPQGVKNIVTLGGIHLMALRDVGVAISFDQGLNWTVYNDGLPTNTINQLGVYDDRVIAATSRHGFWELKAENIQLQAINGRVFFDENTNGQYNTGELLLPNVKLVLEDESDLAFTNQNGEYQLIFVNDGNFGPSLENPYLTAVPGQRNTADTGPLDFALQLDDGQSDFCVSLHTDEVHRPGFSTRYYLHYQNLANTVASASLVLTYFEFLAFNQSSITPSSQQENQLTFELGPLAPLATGTIVVDFTLDVDTPLGTPVLSVLDASIPVADANIENNTFRLEDIVVGSYDPNDIQVNLTRINPTQVSNEIELEYLIRFQNTGNYLADKVEVRNKIADGLNLSSIRNIVTSHPVEVERVADQELAFVFNNIQLPDSTSNESESHGFISYRIKVQPSLLLGDTIPNQAAIFFDFNAPIITNIATTSVDDFTGVRTIAAPNTALIAWPNPVKSGELIQLSAENAKPGILYVFDNLGRCLRTIPHFDPMQDQFATINLPRGQYWVLLETERQWLKGQIVVQ